MRRLRSGPELEGHYQKLSFLTQQEIICFGFILITGRTAFGLGHNAASSLSTYKFIRLFPDPLHQHKLQQNQADCGNCRVKCPNRCILTCTSVGCLQRFKNGSRFCLVAPLRSVNYLWACSHWQDTPQPAGQHRRAAADLPEGWSDSRRGPIPPNSHTPPLRKHTAQKRWKSNSLLL